jgi:NADH-quinone oxidoreductase subunit G
VITTFEDEPYRAPFSGNVTELCPVGALTSTQYRFQARPWDIQNVPSVCGLCPVGCNTSVTIREGKAKRVLSRNHPEVDQGWLCDKGRFSYPHLEARDRITSPLRRKRRMGLEQIDWDTALDEAEALIRGANGRVVTALSGTETVELAYALARLLREGAGSGAAVLPEETSDALDAFRLPLADIAKAEIIVVVGDDPVVERAPIVDLWLRQARRNGAQVVTIGPAGSIQAAPGSAAATCERLAGERDELGQKLRGSDRAVLVWSGPGGHGGATLAALAAELGFHDKPGCGAFHLPATPNGRGVAEAWAAASDREEQGGESIGLLIVSGDEAAADPNVRALAERAERVIAITLFHGLAVGWADLVLPATSYLERDGSLVNLEGRVQRLRRAVVPPVPDEIAWVAKLGARFGIALSPHPAVVFEELSPKLFGGITYGETGDRAPLPARAPLAAAPQAPAVDPEPAPAAAGSLRLVRYRALFSGPAVERVAELQFQRPTDEIELAQADAERLGVAAGDLVTVASNGSSVTLRARVNRRLVAGAARAAEEHVRELADDVTVARGAGA